MPVAFREKPCVVAGDRRKAVVEECVFLPACGGNPTIQKIYRLRRQAGEKKKDFQDLQDFRAAGRNKKGTSQAGGKK